MNQTTMSSILDVIELTKRFRQASAADQRRRRLPDPIARPCRRLLEEAAALGLGLDDVLDAVRRCATTRNHSD